MIKNKKAMFFTLIAITLISLFLISYSIYSISQDRKAINKRIETMNSFVFSLEKDMSRQNYISSYRAILALENKITSTGSFLSDSKSAIAEALLNGTISNENISLMQGYKLQDWSSRVNELSGKQNLLVNYTILNVLVQQENPWNIKISMNILIFIKDKANLASWNKTEVIVSEIEINGFEDPLYLINTNGKATNKINKSEYTFSSDISNLSIHTQNSFYIASTTAPSFLDRLEGKTTGNINGIESLVYLPELSSQGLSVKDKSVVDYIYFSSNNPASHHITGMPSWFKLDDAHLSVYGVESLTSD